MRRVRIVGILLASVWAAACGSSPTAASSTTAAQARSGLLILDPQINATLERWASAPWDVAYDYCYSFGLRPGTPDMVISRVEYSTIGAGGDVYSTLSDASLAGKAVGGGFGGCFATYRDQNVTRPVATTYRITFSFANGEPTIVQTGTISSSVPPQPFITSVTLTDDITDPQKILRRPTPVTFTVEKVEGGAPPYLYQWKMNGFLLRDWDPNPVLTWDGVALGGSPVISGTYTMGVSVRRSTWPDAEAGAGATFTLRYP